MKYVIVLLVIVIFAFLIFTGVNIFIHPKPYAWCGGGIIINSTLKNSTINLIENVSTKAAEKVSLFNTTK